MFLSLISVSVSLSAQNVYTIKADSVLLTNCNDSTELILMNHTQGVPGFLYNTGNGRTAFKRPLTKISDTIYLVGADTLKLRNPNAWVQGGNAFGATGILGTKDNNHLDLYTNNQRRARLDSSGSLLLGFTANSGYKLDVNGVARIYGNGLIASTGDNYDISLRPAYGNAYATSVNGSLIAFGNIFGTIGVNKQAMGTIPFGSLIIGGTSPGRLTTIADYFYNPIFVVDGAGSATINGGYSGIGLGGTSGSVANQNAPNLSINGGRGTGTGVTSDIIFSTGVAQASGTTIHVMTNRWWLKGQTGYLSNTSTPTSAVDVTGANGYSQLRMRTTYTPSSTADTNGNTGDFSWDSNYIYVKTASGWKRSALTTF
jgi:hypothetical protein